MEEHGNRKKEKEARKTRTRVWNEKIIYEVHGSH